MTDFYLRAPDRATMDAALASVRDAQGNPLEDICIDVIPTVTSVTGQNPDGSPIITADPGYHVNVRFLADPTQAQLDALASVTIATPASPYRVWA